MAARPRAWWLPPDAGPIGSAVCPVTALTRPTGTPSSAVSIATAVLRARADVLRAVADLERPSE